MSRHIIALLVVVGIGEAVLGQDDAAKNLKMMQGAWLAKILEIDGKPPSDKEKQVQVKVVIKGDKFTTFFQEKKFTEGTLRLDAAKKPRALDALASEGPAKGMTQAGIYQFDGDEILINFANPGGERPSEFKTKEGTGQVLIRYQRITDGGK